MQHKFQYRNQDFFYIASKVEPKKDKSTHFPISYVEFDMNTQL